MADLVRRLAALERAAPAATTRADPRHVAWWRIKARIYSRVAADLSPIRTHVAPWSSLAASVLRHLGRCYWLGVHEAEGTPWEDVCGERPSATLERADWRTVAADLPAELAGRLQSDEHMLAHLAAEAEPYAREMTEAPAPVHAASVRDAIERGADELLAWYFWRLGDEGDWSPFSEAPPCAAWPAWQERAPRTPATVTRA